MPDLEIDFWNCIAGEELVKKCLVCNVGTYTVLNNTESCKSCLKNAECEGGNWMVVNKGYWRRNKTSEWIHECYEKKACLGGFKEEGDDAVECEVGYSDILCTVCNSTVDSTGRWFMWSGKYQCSYCPKFAYNTLWIIGFYALFLLMVSILIFFNVWKKRDSEVSIASWILTNYTQTISTSISFNLAFPTILTSGFTPASSIG